MLNIIQISNQKKLEKKKNDKKIENCSPLYY